jgi:TRAP-type mannitol/chloroaromatic compound transport system substrate-binding protein
MTDGLFNMQAFAGGELRGPLEILGAVQQGGCPCSDYGVVLFRWKRPCSAIVCGMSLRAHPQRVSGVNYQGGGLELYLEMLKLFNMVAFPMASTAIQIGGWFRKGINFFSASLLGKARYNDYKLSGSWRGRRSYMI